MSEQFRDPIQELINNLYSRNKTMRETLEVTIEVLEVIEKSPDMQLTGDMETILEKSRKAISPTEGRQE